MPSAEGTFRDNLFVNIFPGRTEVPKTLIFAKGDSQADIVQILLEEFGKGNDFAQEITYRTGSAKVRVKKTDKDGNVMRWTSGSHPASSRKTYSASFAPPTIRASL